MIDYLQNIEFVSPYFLLLGLMPIAWYVWSWLRKSSSDTTFTVSTSDAFDGGGSWRAKLTWLPDVLRLLSLLFLVLALARPQLSLKEEKVNAEGIDIMLAMDLSSSMLAKDFEPDRLEVSKQVAEDFVRNRKYDRLGLAVFAGEAFTQCPLTTDQSILIDFLNFRRWYCYWDGFSNSGQ